MPAMPEPFLEPLSERLKDMLEIERQLQLTKTATDPPFAFAFSPLDRDMLRFEALGMVEPQLTHVWHELTWQCCRRDGATVIDVGGNYGYYTLWAAALGCNVEVVEPVAEYRAVIDRGLRSNPGFAQRVRIHPRIVYDRTGINMTLRVPVPVPGSRFKRMLGMAGLVDGAFGLVKGVIDNYINVTASSVTVDDIADLLPPPPAPICMLKADVEGYEPQVVRSASRLLSSGRVEAVQLELTKPLLSSGRAARAQRAATIDMLRNLSACHFDLRQVPNHLVDSNTSLPVRGQAWRSSPGPWATLPRFPSPAILEKTRTNMARNRRAARRRASRDPDRVLHSAMPMAYTRDIQDHSTNLVGRRRYGGAAKANTRSIISERPGSHMRRESPKRKSDSED